MTADEYEKMSVYETGNIYTAPPAADWFVVNLVTLPEEVNRMRSISVVSRGMMMAQHIYG